MTSNLFSWLCLLLFILVLSPLNSLPSLPSPPPLACHPHESSALLHFKNSFSIINDTAHFSYCLDDVGIAIPNSTLSWDINRDCCTWSGVTCDEVTGHVIRLDLKCSGLEGILYSNSSLFLLTHLQTLILSYNYFDGSQISSQFGRFASMTYLDLSHSGFFDQVPLELSYLSNLVTLDLSWSLTLTLETSSWKRIVANLTSLKELFLGSIDLSYTLPYSFVNLSTSLTSLDLSSSGLQGEFPENIFRLPNLQNLDLTDNQNLTGSFPKYNWSSPLRNLSLSNTGFFIDLPHLTRHMKYLNGLHLHACNFTGSYPALLGNFTQITHLDLSSNNFAGEIPWSSFNLQQLAYLDLSHNNFIGQLPDTCGNSSKNSFLCFPSKLQLVGPFPLNLKLLFLSYNKLSGTLPSWLYSLPLLERLYLRGNQFTGQIDEFQYNSLLVLDLKSNKLQGLFPKSIFQQVNLSTLDVSSNNLSGVVSLYNFSKLKNLQGLDLSSNSLSLDSTNNIDYTLPNSLVSLALSSCGITEFPYSLRSLENLQQLDLSHNRIEGSVPQWLWDVGNDSLSFLSFSHNFLTHIDKIPWKNLDYIDLSSNLFQGHLPLPPLSTSYLSISNNQLVGEIPSSICNLSSIEVLDLSNNSLSGNIPWCIGNFSTYLLVLDLRMNKFHGLIPPGFAKENSLMSLNLNGNQLEGSLPQSLFNCEHLEILDIGNNKINGSFPWWLESLPNLQVLILRANKFHGPIGKPKTRYPFQKLRIMDLSNNEFTGLLPENFFGNFVAMMDAHTDGLEYMGDQYRIVASHFFVMVVMKGFSFKLVKIQTMFMSIDFSRNNFTGEIPELIGKLNSLKGLNFSHNNLAGHIPPSLGNLTNLEWLDLSSNELIGKIPLQLATSLNQLGFLNLSENKLEGPIPRGSQFNTFKEDSFTGNVGLCGFPLHKACNQDTDTVRQEVDDGDHKDGIIDWKVVMMGYGCGLVIGISVGYAVLFSTSFTYLLKKRVGRGRLRQANARLRDWEKILSNGGK